LAGVCAGPVDFRGLPGLNTAFATHFGHSHHQTKHPTLWTVQDFNLETTVKYLAQKVGRRIALNFNFKTV
jgi:hypothetical protein